MNITVYDEATEHQTLYLNLNQSYDDVVLEVVDENGNRVFRGALLIINENGVTPCHNVNPDLPFETDDDGRLDIS